MSNTVMVALDVEATGMDPSVDHIIEVGAVKFRGTQILDTYSTLVRPDRVVSLSIANLTGLSNEGLTDAPVIQSVTPKLKAFVGNAPIVGQSIGFDLDMLAAAGLRLTNRRYDTYELATIMLPDLPSYDLATIATRLEVSTPGKHRATDDAETSMRVFNSLLDRAVDFDDQMLDRMIELTAAARSSLAALFRSVRAERRADAEAMSGSTIGAQLMAKLASASAPGPEAQFLVPRDRPPRLEPREPEIEHEPHQMRSLLSSGGPFAGALENYEERSQQAEMMEAVDRTIQTGDQLIVEAGTGTGKSLGYLLPAALHAVTTGERVVVSTATIALQDQLIGKDIPALKQAARGFDGEDAVGFGRVADLNATVLKGRTNYLCLRRWFIANRQPPGDPVEAELHAKVIAWLNVTDTGDRAELRLSPEQQRHWIQLSEEEGSCIPSQCVFHRNNQCFLFRARAKAEAAHLIVVNHALLLSDLFRGGSVLPPYGHLIIDEAQHLEEEATTQAGYTLSSGGLRNLISRVAVSTAGDDGESLLAQTFRIAAQTVPAGQDAMRQAQDSLAASSEAARAALNTQEAIGRLLEDVLDRHAEGLGGHEPRARITTGVRSDPVWSQIEIEWDNLAQDLSTIVEAMRRLASVVEGILEDEEPARTSLLADLELAELDLVTAREHGLAIVSGTDRDIICWITKHRMTGDVSLNSVPLSVAELLQDGLYSRLESLTLTSATLSTEGSFGFIRERLGLEHAEALQVPSPFDYEASTLVGVTDDIPEPNQQGHQKMLQRALIEVCGASQGRAMVLFTSHSALQNSYYAIKPVLERQGIQVLGQRIDGSPRQLIERLIEVPETVLLGTNSFWEGVDIVGDRLSLLVITRLPFSVPTDPVFAARSEQFENPFIQYAVPQAILRFKQGFGRLIRSSRDRGVVAILDRRVISRRYGRAFLASLPPVNVLEAGHEQIAAATRTWLETNQTAEKLKE
ncbi:helicase C-terminal domain-containing protein [soil metagenome]